MKRPPFPLDWPAGWPRTPPPDRRHAKFRVAFGAANKGLLQEIRLLGGSNVVITSDLPIRIRDGLPYANGRADDPGIAVYWNQVVGAGTASTRVVERVMACDRWLIPADNIHSIAKSIWALRGLDRWGSSSMVERAFAGFAALPPAPTDWRAMLGNPRNLDAARSSYRQLALEAHPDRGGSHEAMARLNEAYAAAERELSP